MRKIILFILITLSCSLVLAKEIIRDEYTTCDNGVCNYISNQRFVNEGRGFVTLENAKSLRTVYTPIFKEIDKNYDVEIVDYNYSTVSLCFKTSFLNFNVPFKIYENITTDLTSTTRELLTKNYWFTNVVKQCETFELGENVLGKEFKFGSASTVVQIGNESWGNLQDTYITSNNPTYYAGADTSLYLLNSSLDTRNILITFNITSIPAGTEISEARLSLYISANALDDATEGFNVSSHRINESWNIATWNNQPNYNHSYFSDSLYFFGGAGEPTGRISWNVTQLVFPDIRNGLKNSSIYLRSYEMFGTPSNADLITITSKESTTIDQRSYLNITYFEGDGTPPSVKINYPNASTYYGAGNESVNFNVTAEDNVQVDKCWYTIGSGNIFMANQTVYANLSKSNFNHTNISVADGNYTLTVTCNDTSNLQGIAGLIFEINVYPPVITKINVTSTNPIDLTQPYYCQDVYTPIWSLTTDENAYCYSSNDNSTWAIEITATRNTQSHNLTMSQELTVDYDTAYFKCNNTYNRSGYVNVTTYISYLLGNVTNPIGEAIANASIAVYYNKSYNNMAMQYNTSTNSSGQFKVAVRNGTYTIAAYNPFNLSQRGDAVAFISVPYG